MYIQSYLLVYTLSLFHAGFLLEAGSFRAERGGDQPRGFPWFIQRLNARYETTPAPTAETQSKTKIDQNVKTRPIEDQSKWRAIAIGIECGQQPVQLHSALCTKTDPNQPQNGRKTVVKQ